jgi:hypothetical protein
MKRASVIIVGTPAIWVAQAGALALNDDSMAARAALAKKCEFDAGFAGFPREFAGFVRN